MASQLSIPETTSVSRAARFYAGGAWLVALLPAGVALVFVPQLASPFLVPKASMLIAASGILALCAFWDPQHRPRLPVVFAWILYGGYGWLCVVQLASPLKYMGGWSVALAGAALIVFVTSRSLLPGSEYRFCVALAASAALIAIVALAQLALHFDPFVIFGGTSSQAGRMRIFATLGNPDFAGTFLAACLPAICFLKSRAARWLVLPLVLMGILSTGSRAALLAAAIAMIVYLWTREGSSRLHRSLVVGATMAALIISLWSIAPWNGRRLGTAVEGRRTIWRVALHRVHWFGSGVGSFAYVYLPRVGDAMRDGVAIDSRFITPERHAQNDLVEAIVETGPIGGILAVLLMIAWTRAAWQQRDQYTPLAMATVAAVLTASMFDFPLHRGETLSLLAITFALPFRYAGAAESSGLGRTIARKTALITGACLMMAVALLPVVSSRLMRRGMEAESQNDFRGASVAYQRAAQLCPDNTDALFSHARALARLEDYKAALSSTEVAGHYVSEPELWILEARILESMGENQRAQAEMERAARIFPYSPLPKMEIESIRGSVQH